LHYILTHLGFERIFMIEKYYFINFLKYIIVKLSDKRKVYCFFQNKIWWFLKFLNAINGYVQYLNEWYLFVFKTQNFSFLIDSDHINHNAIRLRYFFLFIQKKTIHFKNFDFIIWFHLWQKNSFFTVFDDFSPFDASF
jgi:hypothetical protein